MTETPSPRRFRFGSFEADAASGELRKQGIRIKLGAQPFQILCLLLERPGELLTRDQIARELWPNGTFVDFDHGVNSAVNRIREALGDNAANPRFVETLARRGYRFVAPVEPIPNPLPAVTAPAPELDLNRTVDPPEKPLFSRVLSSPEELPRVAHPVVRNLFIALQLMYLAFYVGALANLAEIEGLLSSLPHATHILILMIVTAALLIPVRAFVLSAVLLRPPAAQRKILKVWQLLLPLDILWALSPFLLLHHISSGLALSCMALLVYSPFAQRSLVLMGAAESVPFAQIR